jgi:hypothetical protein
VTALGRDVAALSIVCRQAQTVYFPAAELEKKAATMTFGQAVRELRRLNEANFRSLAVIRKDLEPDGEAMKRCYAALRARINATYGAAAAFAEWPPLPCNPTLRHAGDLLGQIEMPDHNGQTRLMAAARIGNLASVRGCLLHGADVNAHTQSGMTALMIAGHKRQAEVAKLLLEAGADVRARSESGVTALYWAKLGGHKETVELITKAAPDLANDIKLTWKWQV